MAAVRVHLVSLSAHVLKALASRSGIDPAVVDDVVWGCVSQVGEQTMDIARNAVLAAGSPESVTGVTVDRQCGSSSRPCTSRRRPDRGPVRRGRGGRGGIHVRLPMASLVQGGNPLGPEYLKRYGGVFPNQGVGAEIFAERWGFCRTQVHEFSVGSHEKAAAAQDAGGSRARSRR